MAQHHFGREDQRARIDLVLAGILRCGAVRRLETGVLLGNVGTGRNADTAHLRRQRIGNVIAVQVGGNDHIVFGRAQQDLLQKGVGDRILDGDFATALRVDEMAPRTAIDHLRTELLLRHLVGDVAEQTLGEFHDVALVHDGQRLAIVGDDVVEGGTHQTGGAFDRDRLDADAGSRRETDFLDPHFLFQEGDHFFRAFRLRGPFDTGIDVFGVLAEDHHIGQFGIFQWRGHALEILHRPDALVEVELLAQGDVERADAAADRRRHRPLDRDRIFLERGKGFLREPLVRAIDAGRLFPGIDLHPVDFPFAAVSLVDRCVDHLDHDRRDIDTDTVALDEGNDRLVGSRLAGNDFLASLRDLDVRNHSHSLSC